MLTKNQNKVLKSIYLLLIRFTNKINIERLKIKDRDSILCKYEQKENCSIRQNRF